jgi:glycine dehydrogenase
MSTFHFEDEKFVRRHVGPDKAEEKKMLETIGVASLDALIDKTVPPAIRSKSAPAVPAAMSESQYLSHLKSLAGKNKMMRSYIGLGYYDCITPGVILRNILENPGWYTQYTPYQAEISQGRIEAMLNYQTMVCDLTGMAVANSSLLDEGTAAAEAMIMFHSLVHRSSDRKDSNKFFVAASCFPQTIDVVKTRANALGFEVVVGDPAAHKLDAGYFGALVQSPDADGLVHDEKSFIEAAHAAGVLVVVATDLMSLVMLTPPGEMGADVVVGSSQRFGVPMGFGGPHAAFFAGKMEQVRYMPGRIMGVSIDAQGNPAMRMALQTREQHIKREKATSNICTAQALLAIMASMYGVFHGPDGLRRIASNIHNAASALEAGLKELGYKQENAIYFDTLRIAVPDAARILALGVAKGMNFRMIDGTHIGIAVDETTRPEDVEAVLGVFAEAAGRPAPSVNAPAAEFAAPHKRTSDFLTNQVFNRNHSETEVMRYIKKLETRDLSLTQSMIPLGSCTMKLNAVTELEAITWPEFTGMHPFAPADQAAGYHAMVKGLGDALCAITGFAAVSFQPNSGAQGEYTGLSVIHAYLKDKGQHQRDVLVIPTSAHGTNPASAVMAGFKLALVNCDEHGNIDVADLRVKAEAAGDTLAGLMVTYPSTHGVFEESIMEICSIIHEHGGQVYMDGANMNAQVGLTSPALIGADVCHINLHKTFAIPHGGGGPGMGPICVAAHLAPYLPGHVITNRDGGKAIGAVSAAHYGSASILPISYGYIRMLGPDGLTDASKYAILNANYLRARLEGHYPVLYVGKNGFVAHEFIIDLHDVKARTGVEAIDVAKRLMDYGFHAPTVAFPVHDTLMVEPTESEPLSELDRLADALIKIRKEIEEIAEGKADPKNNLLKNSPHTAMVASADEWPYPYSRERAVYPMPELKTNKFWPSVGRINDSYGDRNLMCVCP